jgi:hypothetical protein
VDSEMDKKTAEKLSTYPRSIIFTILFLKKKKRKNKIDMGGGQRG